MLRLIVRHCSSIFTSCHARPQASPILTIFGWVVLTGKNMAQISDGISNPAVAGIGYWLIRILVCGGCLVDAGILVAFIGIKIAGLYKKYCWDMITIMVILISMARSQRISLKQKYKYFIGTICIYFHANIYYHISMKGAYI